MPLSRAGATVIAFPPRKAELEAKARLDRAMASLLRATQEQSEAVALWRGALAELSQTMGDLTHSMGRYQFALAETGAKVEALGRDARQLEATMDAVLDGTLAPGIAGTPAG